MKKRLYRAKVVVFMLGVISVMGMTACSFEPKEKIAPEATIEPKTTEEKTLETENKKAETEVEKAETAATPVKKSEEEESAVGEIIEGDPIVNTSIAESEILAYITDLNDDKISIDVVEWIMVPSSRADELGIKEEDGPSGFYIYNPDTLTEQFTLSADCTITILDWQNSFETQSISAEKFVAALQERGEQNNFIPYSFKVRNGTITEISEHYVP